MYADENVVNDITPAEALREHLRSQLEQANANIGQLDRALQDWCLVRAAAAAGLEAMGGEPKTAPMGAGQSMQSAYPG